MKKSTHQRHWLNPKEGTAFVQSSSTLTQYSKGGAWMFEAQLTVADCHRHITLDFDAATQEGAAERLRKVDILRRQLDLLEEELLNAYCILETKAEAEADRKARAKKVEIQTSPEPSTIWG